MKHFLRPAAFIAAAIITGFAQPAQGASGKPAHTAITQNSHTKDPFSIELIQQGTNEIVFLTIKNPGKKNLSVTLSGPDGSAMDNFYTGKKLEQISKKYNFSGADAGVYSIEVTDGKEKIKKQVKLERFYVKTVNKLTVQ